MLPICLTLYSCGRCRWIYVATSVAVLLSFVVFFAEYPFLLLLLFRKCGEAKTRRAAADDSDFSSWNVRYNLSDWMSALPASKQRTALNKLAIPGSHNSGTSYRPSTITLSPTASRDIVHYTPVWSLVKDHVPQWDANQDLSFTRQLELGIRYFDFRACYDVSTKKFRFFHTLFYAPIYGSLKEINAFLTNHPKEIILLHVLKTCSVTENDHISLIDILVKAFKDKLCPRVDVRNLTLSYLWKRKRQVLLFYDDDYAPKYRILWPHRELIISPWADTSDLATLKKFLDDNFLNDTLARSTSTFYVNQGVLTATLGYIRANPCGSLRDLAVKANRALVRWLKSKMADKHYVTICMADFVEISEFAPAVIDLNF